jgi:hypothetical protein
MDSKKVSVRFDRGSSLLSSPDTLRVKDHKTVKQLYDIAFQDDDDKSEYVLLSDDFGILDDQDSDTSILDLLKEQTKGRKGSSSEIVLIVLKKPSTSPTVTPRAHTALERSNQTTTTTDKASTSSISATQLRIEKQEKMQIQADWERGALDRAFSFAKGLKEKGQRHQWVQCEWAGKRFGFFCFLRKREKEKGEI